MNTLEVNIKSQDKKYPIYIGDIGFADLKKKILIYNLLYSLVFVTLILNNAWG